MKVGWIPLFQQGSKRCFRNLQVPVGRSHCGLGVPAIPRMMNKANDDVQKDKDTTAARTRQGIPPQARRDNHQFVWAGKFRQGTDDGTVDDDDSDDDEDDYNTSSIQLQAANSPHGLVDPPRPIPNPYGWLQDPKDPLVMNHLEAENVYTQQQIMDPLKELHESIYQELRQDMIETDFTMPIPHGPYHYYQRTFANQSYRVHCRAPLIAVANNPTDEIQANIEHKKMILHWDGHASSPVMEREEVILDENEICHGLEYCATGHVKPSPSHDLLAFTLDSSGNEKCSLIVVSLRSSTDTNRVIQHHDETMQCDGSLEWGLDDSTLFYVKKDEAHRSFQVYRRILLANQNHDDGKHQQHNDMLLYEEADPRFHVSIGKSRNERFLFIRASSAETSEVWYVDLLDQKPTVHCIGRRRWGVLYDVEYHEPGHSWILSLQTKEHPHRRLVMCPVHVCDNDDFHVDSIEDIVRFPLFDGTSNTSGRFLEYVLPFQNHLVVVGREQGLPQMWIIHLTQGDGNEEEDFRVERLDASSCFPESAHDIMAVSPNFPYHSSVLLLSYESMVTPLQHRLIDLQNPLARHTILHERVVPGYDKTLYRQECMTVPSRCGAVEIPVTMVYRKDAMENAKRHQESLCTHLYGYGAYGASLEVAFRFGRLPLLNRGAVCVLVHVRGGGEWGWVDWYQQGKYTCKANSFDDFVDVARWLIESKQWTSPDKLSCEGRSAGGLLIAASVNQDPQLFAAALLCYPFVDVVCTMLDPTMPLVCAEWEEWGNPHEEEYLEYMLSYSPLYNVQPHKKYPDMLLTGALQDPRVAFWEPVKYAAELRHQQVWANICVRVEMAAGHGSASDRYQFLWERALQLAFLVDRLGMPCCVLDKSKSDAHAK